MLSKINLDGYVNQSNIFYPNVLFLALQFLLFLRSQFSCLYFFISIRLSIRFPKSNSCMLMHLLFSTSFFFCFWTRIFYVKHHIYKRIEKHLHIAWQLLTSIKAKTTTTHLSIHEFRQQIENFKTQNPWKYPECETLEYQLVYERSQSKRHICTRMWHKCG